MTYIEFFDKTSIENICGCLTCAPDRVILIGKDAKPMIKQIELYTELFEQRGIHIDFLYKTVQTNDIIAAIELISDITETYDDCVFDITGGDEMLVFALGEICGRNPDRNIQVHKFNLRNGKIYDGDRDGTTVYHDLPAITVDENIMIYGGKVAYGDVDEEKTYIWDLNEEFVNDLNTMWNICRHDLKTWNSQLGVFAAAEFVSSNEGDPLTTVANCNLINGYLATYKTHYQRFDSVVNKLIECGLITSFNDTDGNVLTIKYKNAQVKRCLVKAGQVLEMKIFLLVHGLVSPDKVPIYHDIVNGVVIDWDGLLDGGCDTENEIDILLMHGVVPVFISCKNGIVTTEELYKLNTVAERFGGKYSKKVLITTSLDTRTEKGAHIKQRASDMKINLIERAATLEDSDLEKLLKNLWAG